MDRNIDDRLLVRQVLSGNRKAFEQLVRQYEGLVLHIVTPIIGHTADREDICQDIFIKVYEKLETFQFRSKLSTWIGNIAYNTSINFLQKRKNILMGDLFSEQPGVDFSEETFNADEILIEKENTKLLLMAVDRLPGIQKSILLLFHMDELSLEEISQLMEIPVNTVKSHLFRARKSLKEMLTA